MKAHELSDIVIKAFSDNMNFSLILLINMLYYGNA